jgi:hypothetical protein
VGVGDASILLTRNWFDIIAAAACNVGSEPDLVSEECSVLQLLNRKTAMKRTTSCRIGLPRNMLTGDSIIIVDSFPYEASSAQRDIHPAHIALHLFRLGVKYRPLYCWKLAQAYNMTSFMTSY